MFALIGYDKDGQLKFVSVHFTKQSLIDMVKPELAMFAFDNFYGSLMVYQGSSGHMDKDRTSAGLTIDRSISGVPLEEWLKQN